MPAGRRLPSRRTAAHRDAPRRPCEVPRGTSLHPPRFLPPADRPAALPSAGEFAGGTPCRPIGRHHSRRRQVPPIGGTILCRPIGRHHTPCRAIARHRSRRPNWAGGQSPDSTCSKTSTFPDTRIPGFHMLQDIRIPKLRIPGHPHSPAPHAPRHPHSRTPAFPNSAFPAGESPIPLCPRLPPGQHGQPISGLFPAAQNRAARNSAANWRHDSGRRRMPPKKGTASRLPPGNRAALAKTLAQRNRCDTGRREMRHE